MTRTGGTFHNDIVVLIIRLGQEDFRQLIQRQQSMLINVVFLLDPLGDALVDRDVYLPENEGVWGNVIKCGPLFTLDGAPKCINGPALRDLDQKDAAGIITKHQTVEVELRLWFGLGSYGWSAFRTPKASLTKRWKIHNDVEVVLERVQWKISPTLDLLVVLQSDTRWKVMARFDRYWFVKLQEWFQWDNDGDHIDVLTFQSTRSLHRYSRGSHFFLSPWQVPSIRLRWCWWEPQSWKVYSRHWQHPKVHKHRCQPQ